MASEIQEFLGRYYVVGNGDLGFGETCKHIIAEFRHRVDAEIFINALNAVPAPLPVDGPDAGQPVTRGIGMTKQLKRMKQYGFCDPWTARIKYLMRCFWVVLLELSWSIRVCIAVRLLKRASGSGPGRVFGVFPWLPVYISMMTLDTYANRNILKIDMEDLI